MPLPLSGRRPARRRSRRRSTAIAVLLVAVSMSGAASAAIVPPAEALSCEAAGAEAERAAAIPTGLLAAIGRRESGRFDPASGRVSAWPWTINANGQGYYFDSRDEAIAAVAALRMRGVQSIDVGCFQINLMYHPAAFESLEQAFDIRANATYAAHFLADLQARSGSWEQAVAWYHSATPGLGEPYRDQVLADWTGGGMRILPSPPPQAASPGRDPYVISVAATSFGIHVWTPSWADRPVAIQHPSLASAAQAGAMPLRHRAGNLPHIVTPRG